MLTWLQHGRAETTQYLSGRTFEPTQVTLLDADEYRPINIEFGGLYCSHAFYIANPNGDLHLGSTYLSAVGWALPPSVWRAFGVAKPPRIADAEIGKWVRNADGYGFSFFLEGYLNFGMAGCLAAGLVLGMLVSWLDSIAGYRGRLFVGVSSTLIVYFVRANSEVFAVTLTGTMLSLAPGLLLALPFVVRQKSRLTA